MTENINMFDFMGETNPPRAVFQATSAKIIEHLHEGNGATITGKVARDIFNIYENAHNSVVEHFPGAKAGTDVIIDVLESLERHGLNESNILFGQSVCPDEINHGPEAITSLLASRLEKVFHLGGLAGIPFTGKTGFAAFKHHVFDGGNLFILFAPHIGISCHGVLGKYSRKHQHVDGTACGAAVGAYTTIQNGGFIPDETHLGENPFDYQQQRIVFELSKRIETINSKESENERAAELARQMFDITKIFLENIIDLEIGGGEGGAAKCGKVALLGGIQINMPEPMHDYFQPLLFQIRCKGEPTIDLMESSWRSVGSKKYT